VLLGAATTGLVVFNDLPRAGPVSPPSRTEAVAPAIPLAGSGIRQAPGRGLFGAKRIAAPGSLRLSSASSAPASPTSCKL
jgi:hypothetical protein